MAHVQVARCFEPKNTRAIMTTEAQIEEILHEADGYSLRQEVMDSARDLIENHNTERVLAYELAFQDWVK
jgi:hypothetical protein